MNIISSLPKDKELGFGIYFAPLMLQCKFSEGKWAAPEITSVANLELHPAAKVLHYAQEIFEGLKAFKRGKEICLFRPRDNIRRMHRSAEIMAMPPFPEEVFLKGMVSLIAKTKDLVPEAPGALYLRPTMIGTSTQLGVAPSSEYLFYILASPVGGYFGKVNSDKPASISMWVTNEFTRAASGGVGAAKTGANYASSLRAVAESKKRGFSNVLFLDPIKRQTIEELSGMNIFVVQDGILKTPPLKDTILDGITRKTLIELARSLDIGFKEEATTIDDLVEGARSGRVSEVLACGTGASVTNISSFGWKDETITIGKGLPGPITTRLYQTLMSIQTGNGKPLHDDWIVSC